MRKIFLATVFALILGLQSFCGAAVINEARHYEHENIIYPMVDVGDFKINTKINNAIEAEINRFIDSAYGNAKDIDAKVADIRSSYEIGSNQSGNTVILSVLLTESQYYEGAAHPATFQRALNFNTSSGELMDITYLTDIGSGVSKDELLKKLERKLIEKCKREDLFLYEDATPLKALPDEFYWDKNLHVHFIFQQYEIAPYAVGIIDVDING
ncbi:MAG: DUF3298 and DUF4163 domain-containing protein [Selenomonadaceae bacterium]|nr:DUF3298 and DUF4163 domain-containing protein [Selenomonadaceae bacterium]